MGVSDTRGRADLGVETPAVAGKPSVLCCHLANTNEESVGLVTPIPPFAKLLWSLLLLYNNGKCLPVLLYGLAACSLSKSDLSSIDFAFNRFFMKLFRTDNIETVKVCQSFFGISLPSVVLRRGQASSNRNLVFVRT